MLENHLRPSRPVSRRSQEVINPPQIPPDDVNAHVCEPVCVCWEEKWWESSVGSQSLSPSPEALPKSGVITPDLEIEFR